MGSCQAHCLNPYTHVCASLHWEAYFTQLRENERRFLKQFKRRRGQPLPTTPLSITYIPKLWHHTVIYTFCFAFDIASTDWDVTVYIKRGFTIFPVPIFIPTNMWTRQPPLLLPFVLYFVVQTKHRNKEIRTRVAEPHSMTRAYVFTRKKAILLHIA